MNNPEVTGTYNPVGNALPAEVDVELVELPPHIGRYRVEKVLGEGAFGLVYLAHDDQLQRLVAIKVLHRGLLSTTESADAYLTEARTVANLDHPHIVPVFDVGGTNDFPCCVVSKYIDGTDLASRLKQTRLSLNETVELVATVAEALHFAHKQGLVHRDIKPGNLLLDKSGKPFVSDFGLALREQDVGKGPRYAGTPAYMSPEQARGEGNRVDGRSDIFSLGVVFYELLVGRRPFKAGTKEELLEQIASFEPRPPRQYDEKIPKELERICLKSLSKQLPDRYLTAKDMADDIRLFLKGPNETATIPKPGKISLNATFGKMGCALVITLSLMVAVGGVLVVMDGANDRERPSAHGGVGIRVETRKRNTNEKAAVTIVTMIAESGTMAGYGPLVSTGAIMREEQLWSWIFWRRAVHEEF